MADPSDELWAAILAAPEEDAPRLVYGDLLLARGDVHGELIQIQCSNSPDSALRRREAELVADRERWLGNELGDEGFAELLATPYLGRLEELAVGNNDLHDASIAALCARADALPALTQLRFENNPITDEGMRMLCESRLAPRLRRVGVWGGHDLSSDGKALYANTFGKWRSRGWPGS